MHRWLIDQDSSVSSEMPDGQGVWHYDDEVNICNTYIWIFLFLYIFMYLYIYIYIMYLWPCCICHLKFVSLLLLCCCCCFLSLSLLFFVMCCLWYSSSDSFDFLVLWCELIQSGVVGSGWSFFFVPVFAWRIVLTCCFFNLFHLVCYCFCVLFFSVIIYNISVYLYQY